MMATLAFNELMRKLMRMKMSYFGHRLLSTIYFSERIIFHRLFSRAHLIISFCTSHEAKCVTFENLNFSQKEVFCKKFSCSVNILGKYAFDFIKNEP